VLSEVIPLDQAVRTRGEPHAPLADAHQQMLYRLGVERDERLRLREERDRCTTSKAALQATLAKTSELKAAVDSQMESVTAAAASLQGPMAHVIQSDGDFHPHASLLPSPLYALGLSAVSYFKASGSEATLNISGDVAAAQALAQLTSKEGTSQDASQPTPDDALEAHPLAVEIRLASSVVSFRYYPQLQLLAAGATSATADAVLHSLGSHLSTSNLSSQPEECDDGRRLPDLCTRLRWHRVTGGRDVDMAALSPHRPYKWLQWLGGLGPLLTTAPQPSQLVLGVLMSKLAAL